MSWAPSYSVDTTDPADLVVRQKAVIKNELESFEEAEIGLISGFPNIPFAHVTSPLSPRTDWARFFQELNHQFRGGHASTMNVLSQQAITLNEPLDDGILAADRRFAWLLVGVLAARSWLLVPNADRANFNWNHVHELL